MINSFFKITFRLLWRNKTTSLINISSLTFGIAAFILIMIYVHHEYNIDKFNKNYDRIFRVEADDYGKLAPLMGEYLINEIPEIEQLVRFAANGRNQNFQIKSEEGLKSIKNLRASSLYADSSVFNVFTIPLSKGDPQHALIKPFTAVISESLSKKMFGKEDPMNKVFDQGRIQWTVKGVMKDIEHAHFECDAFFSHNSMEKRFHKRDLNRKSSDYHLWSPTYVLLHPDADISLVETKINDVLGRLDQHELFGFEFTKFQLRSLGDIYLTGAIAHEGTYARHGNLLIVRSFIAIAIFILAMAIINYVNLTTAKSSLRAKEVAIKKVTGSAFWRLRLQFIFESIIVTSISFMLALTLTQAFISPFSNLVQIEFSLSELNNAAFWALSFGGILAIGFISGLYPAIFLTSINSISLMKGEQKHGSGATIIRRILLSSQFVVSILLIIAIITNLRQLNYTRSLDLGFNQELIILKSTGGDNAEVNQSLKNRILEIPGVKGITFSSNGIGGDPAVSPVFEIDGVKKTLNFITIDPEYIPLMDLEMVQGRAPDWNRLSDKIGDGKPMRLIINETGMEYLGMEEIGNLRVSGQTWEIIGVVKDFHYKSIHHQIEPLVLGGIEGGGHMANIKLSGYNMTETLHSIEKIWKETMGVRDARSFTYQFLDEVYAKKYKTEERAAELIGYFTVLAILISCMGLFALSSFMVSRKTKEIGIRKALGATVPNIFLKLSKEYLKWILLSLTIATPVGWYMMHKWLERFAYKIDLGIGVFISAGCLTIMIALITVSWQSLKTARANPVRALRYE